MKTLIFVVVLLLMSGCGAEATTPEDGRLTVVTTIGQVTDIVQEVGGEYVNVVGLMGSGVDPHQYQASESDVSKLAEADLIFYNGLFLEALMEKVFEQMPDKAVPVTQDMPPDRLLDWDEYEDAFDPHVWFEVPLWMEAVKTVRDTLVAKDPANAEAYQANAEAYLAELEELDSYIQQEVARVEPDKRVLITAHDAFNYFARTYGFDMQGLQGISTVSEASTVDVQRLADLIVERQIPAIFVESSVPRRTIEAVQAAVEAQGFAVKIGGELFSDAIGAPDTPEGTYIGAFRHNIDTIVAGLAE